MESFVTLSTELMKLHCVLSWQLSSCAPVTRFCK